jgi:hypothetical protein
VFRVWVLQERNAQGLGIATSRRVDISGPVNDISNVACTIVDVRFLLWNGSAEESGALPSHQCGCYTRETSAWTPIALGPDACKIAGE